jgi:hypothetical protein
MYWNVYMFILKFIVVFIFGIALISFLTNLANYQWRLRLLGALSMFLFLVNGMCVIKRIQYANYDNLTFYLIAFVLSILMYILFAYIARKKG